MSAFKRVMLSDDMRDPLWRFRVELEPDHDLVTVAFEDVTSRSEKAEVTNTRGAIDFYPDDLEWLIGALAEAREALRKSRIDR